MHLLDYKRFDIIDARYNHEEYCYTLGETDVIKYKLMPVVPHGRLRKQFQYQKFHYALA